MFGSQYYSHPEILLQSLHEMNGRYVAAFPTMSGMKRWLSGAFIRIMGIPEIGFQERGLYFRQAVRSIPNFSPKAILDVGSGIGCYVFYMAKKFPEAMVVGWEIDRKKLKYSTVLLNEFNPLNVKFQVGDILNPPKKNNVFDFVSIIDVMEHIQAYEKVIRNLHALLSVGGYVFIHVPQVKQKRFFSVFKSWEHDDHVREGFDPLILENVLQTSGFRVIRRRNSFGYFGSLAWELNHLLLQKNQVLAAVFYPFLYGLSIIDTLVHNTRGLGVAILAQKI